MVPEPLRRLHCKTSRESLPFPIPLLLYLWWKGPGSSLGEITHLGTKPSLRQSSYVIFLELQKLITRLYLNEM